MARMFTFLLVDRFRQASNVADVQIQTLDEMENSIKGIVI